MIGTIFNKQKGLSISILIIGLGVIILDLTLFRYFKGLYINSTLINQSEFSILIFSMVIFNLLGIIFSIVLLNYKNEIRSLKNKIQLKSEQISTLEEKVHRICKEKELIDIDKFSITIMETKIIKILCNQPELTNKEIGLNLFIKTGTVKQYMNSIFKKLDINSRQELIDRCQWKFKNQII